MKRRRWGRIRRRIARQVFSSDEFTELRLLPPRLVSAFPKYVASGRISAILPIRATDERILRRLNRAKYLDACRHCYMGAFGIDSSVDATDLYRTFADGRHGGLLSLPSSNASAFDDWFHQNRFAGAHPFEIFRNEVILTVHAAPSHSGYWFRLGPRIGSRVSPYLISMAFALVRGGVPFVMSGAVEHARFACGDDWIGVADDSILERGTPAWPADSGILNAPQNSLLLSQFDAFPALKRNIRWFEQPIALQRH